MVIKMRIQKKLSISLSRVPKSLALTKLVGKIKMSASCSCLSENNFTYRIFCFLFFF